MKKVMDRLLALTLCGVLLVAPVLAAEPAAFTDAAQIEQWEAVATLAQLGVISGKDDGSFDPTGNVTRAEAAKLLAVLAAGDEELPLPEEAGFDDTQGHWAQRYIAYCAGAGIISGRGDGRFDPDATVTGSELAKMALVILGYNPMVYGLTGKDWEINTNMLANSVDTRLYENMKGIKPNEPLSREDAAQLLYNMLNATVIKATVVTNDEEAGEPYTKYQKMEDENGQPVSFLNVRFGLSELPEVPEQPK